MKWEINHEPLDKNEDSGEEEKRDQPTYEDEHEEVFYVNKHRLHRRLQTKVRFNNDQATLVGLVDAHSSKLICHICYGEGHIAPQCTLKLLKVYNVVTNYETLTADDLGRVPFTSYNDTTYFLSVKSKASQEPK